MGTSQSREDRFTDSESEEEYEEEKEQEKEHYDDALSDHRNTQSSSSTSSGNSKSIDDIDAKLKSLKLKYNSPQQPSPNLKNPVKLYLHIGGNTPKAKWVISEKLTSYSFTKKNDDDDDDDDESCWVLEVGSKVKARVSTEMQLKMFGDQKRVDFVDKAVWALKFLTDEEYRNFVTQFQNCLFENVYGMEATEENKIKVYGKEFIGWMKPEAADDSMWEDAEDHSSDPAPVKGSRELMEEFEEASNGGVQSLALGALDNSFLVNDLGVQVYRNFNRGINAKGICVKFDAGGSRIEGNMLNSTPKKALLMKAETNMMLMSPAKEGKPNATGLKQVDIETGKIVTEWKFEKDGADVTMRDITNDTKGSQLDPSESTFLGLDDNRLCQWDMRDQKGMVQNIATSDSPVLHWTKGHQFSRGTNFQCFASTGDGSIVVGSLDGKIRLYSKTSMRQAKTAFPGLGSPIIHLDVTYDGKWILGTTDTYLILICTMFTDKDGKTKTGLVVTENGKQERHLVATVGKFSVIWDFQQVKNSAHECYRNQQGLKSCYCYKIILKDESIIESRFMHDNFAASNSPEAPLVVATPMKVSSISLFGRR
ncbi:Protein CYPRO4 [Hibiscus syriacus]|uniref:Protein CYPRO4 n=1 Tax=Hibiscus syriacus TaxID=106335 RepID=A0A6A3AK30_HIBSY|nr:Protein CYPRO4 [Hibiscus syriacus]